MKKSYDRSEEEGFGDRFGRCLYGFDQSMG